MTISDKYKIGKYKVDIYAATRRLLRKIASINIETTASTYIKFLSKLSKEDLKKLASNPKHKLRYGDLPNPKIDLINQLTPIYEELWSSMIDIGINHYLLSELVNSGAVDETTIASHLSDNFGRLAMFETASEAEINAIRELQLLKEKLQLAPGARRAFNLSPLYSSTADLTLQQRMSYLETALKINNRYKRQQAVKEVFLLSKYMRNRYRVLATYSADSIDSNIRNYVSEYITKRRLTDRVIDQTAVDALQLRENIARELRDNLGKGSRAAVIANTETSLGYNIGKLMGFTSPEDLQRRMVWRNDFEKENTSPYYKICDYCEYMNGRSYTVSDLLRTAAVPPRGILNYGKKGGQKTEFKNELYPIIPGHPNCLLPGTKVSTQNGYVNIESSTVGMLVKVPTASKLRKVTKLHKNWVNGEQVYKIRTDSGQELHITGNHPVWNGSEWKEARFVLPGEVLYRNTSSYTQTQGRNYIPVSETYERGCGVQEVEVVKSDSVCVLEDVRPDVYQARDERCSSEYSGKAQKVIRSNDSKQSEQESGNLKENGTDPKGEGHSVNALYLSKWKRSVQVRASRGYKYVCSQFLGSKRSPNTELVGTRVGVRETSSSYRHFDVLSRFLHTFQRPSYRSERLLDGGRQTQMEHLSREVPSHEQMANHGQGVQTTEELFQGISAVRVVEVTSYNYTGYVYNLSVEDDHYYFANDILVHNCGCFWEVIDSEEDQLLREKQYARTKVLKAVGITALASLGITAGLLLARKNTYGTLLKSIVKTNSVRPDSLAKMTARSAYNNAAEGLGVISNVLGTSNTGESLLRRLIGGGRG